MSTTPISFTGVSTYSSDFQSILARQVSIAQLPLQSLQIKQSNNTSVVQLLGSLGTAVAALGSSIAALGAIGANKGLGAASSDTSTATVANTGATQAKTYTISDITSVASAASETSTSGYADSTATPVLASGNNTLDLLVGSTHYTVTLKAGENNLVGVQNEINSSGAPVTATILTTGTGANANYLSVTANSMGASTLQLTGTIPVVGSTDLLTGSGNAGAQGSDAIFKLDNLPVDRKTNVVNDVISGLTFNILQTSANAVSSGKSGVVTLTLASDTTALGSALNNLTTNYNAVVDQVAAQTGPNSGLLNGDPMLRQVMDDMRQFTSYQGPTGISLATLGISFDLTGKMSFSATPKDQTPLASLSGSVLTDAFTFLGSPTSGLGAIASQFNTLSDPVSGLIQTETTGRTNENTTLTNEISSLNDRITTMANALTLRLDKADAAVAALQTQQQVLTGSIQSMNLALYGKNTG